MLKHDYSTLYFLESIQKQQTLDKLNIMMTGLTAEERIAWSLKNLPCVHVMSSSFGIHSIVLLHMMVTQKPDIPIILVDTGYLFNETYRFIDCLTNKLNLNLNVFRSKISPAWQESRYGQLWTKGIKGITLFNKINKVQPFNDALKKLSVQTWFSGLRRVQSKSRKTLVYCSFQKKVLKILPILDWSNNKISTYIKEHNLDEHPLSKEGYRSVGDIHTTKKYMHGMKEEETRFFGLKRECGLHENNFKMDE